MQYQLQREAAIIGARRRERLTPVLSTPSSYIREEKVKLTLVLAFFAAHVPLAILMSANGYIATLHAFATIAVALWLAVASEKIERVAYAAAYITGAEVLWRMTHAGSFWEIGKYGVAAVFIVAMMRNRRAKPSVLPVLYFVLLLPSALITFLSLPLSQSRHLLSDSMSGPLAMMVAGCFFSQLSLTPEKLLRLFIALIGPIIGVAAVALFGIATTEEIVFGGESSHAASGGFGPNQVSSVLGLGTLTCFLILPEKDVDLKLKILCGAVMMFVAAQSALTFSRGGLYNAAGAVVLASLFLLKDSRTRIQLILAIILVSGISYFVIFPQLNNFTDGALSARFEDTEMTGREDIVHADLNIWFDNFILGVGPGLAKGHRGEFGRAAAAHTEFTRLLAEHGVFGLVALFVFAGAAARNLVAARTARDKGLIIAVTAWSFFFMLNAGMRLVAPAMMFGLAFAHFLSASNVAPALSKHGGAGMPAPRLRGSVFSKAHNPQISRRAQTRITPISG
jgi:hypothetical protein